MNTYHKGILAEHLAKTVMLLKGFIPREHRFKTPVGEIDLIMESVSTVAFIEVKRRQNFRGAAESISASQQRRIARAAAFYLQKNPNKGLKRARFDVILVNRWGFLQHVKNAFFAE